MLRFPILCILLALVPAGCVSANPDYSTAGRQAVATADVNLRAGPGTRFPVVQVVPAGASVTVYGCLDNYSWCDVAYADSRGWLSSRYISLFYDSRVYVQRPVYATPIIGFNYGYWDTWYRGYPWYASYRWRYPYYGYPYRRYPYYSRYPNYRYPDRYPDGVRRNDDVFIYPRVGIGVGDVIRND